MKNSTTISGITYESLDFGAIAWCPDCKSYVYGRHIGKETCSHNNLKIIVTAEDNKNNDYTLLGPMISSGGSFALHVNTSLLEKIKENPNSILCCYDKGETLRNNNNGTWLFVNPTVYLNENDEPEDSFDVYGRIVF